MTASAFQYHHSTSYDRHKMTGHHLDWQDQPLVFKDYPGITPVSLPENLRLPERNFYSLLKETDNNVAVKGMDVEKLSMIMHLTCSLTARSRQSGGDFYFRSVPSAGALYPTEIYVATHSVIGLENGLYHFAPHRNCLYPIRTQELSQYVNRVTCSPDNKNPILLLFMTAIFFRSAWKYRERSYRYHLLDTGHLVENLTLALKALRVPFSLSYDFDDGQVNHLLGLDETKEVSLAVAHVFGDNPLSHIEIPEIDGLPEEIRKASRVARNETDYPAIQEMHLAGISVISEVGSGPEMGHEPGITPETWTKNTRPSTWPVVMKYPDVIFNRRSRRNFVNEPVARDCIMALLDSLCITGFENSSSESRYNQSVCTGLLVGNAEGVAPGFYLLDTLRESMGLITSGSFMEAMAHICLDQVWLTNAAVHFLFLANLDVLDRTWGARGYRYAMMAAGRMGERLYLDATAMGIGCCGIGAFYDGEAAELLGLNNESRLLYLAAIGTVKKL